MSLSEVFSELVEKQEISLQQILNNLLDGSKDLDLKTHINHPKDIASLYMLADYFKKMKLPKSSNILDFFIEKYLRAMISFKRMSRKEIILAVSNMLESEQPDSTIFEKMVKDKSK